MSMALIGKGGEVRLSNASWRGILLLAHEYGWRPAETEPYARNLLSNFTNEAQRVTAEDAENITSALERALAEGADYATDQIRDFIVFCRIGGFCIR